MTMNDTDAVTQAALLMADAIGRRDVAAIAGLLAAGFVHHTPGGASSETAAFLDAIQRIPGKIRFVRLEHLRVEIAGDSALASGVQHARVDVEGQEIDDRRAFVDWLIRDNGRWKFRAAVDLPAPEEPPTSEA
jgi:ketosteroid isomerase-like protein